MSSKASNITVGCGEARTASIANDAALILTYPYMETIENTVCIKDVDTLRQAIVN